MVFVEMNIGCCYIKFALHGVRSLKDKRRVAKTIKDRVKNKFNISVAEVNCQDIHGILHIGVAAVGSDTRYLEGLMNRTVNFIEEMYLADMVDYQIKLLRLGSN
tara:strand:- start:1948 stop:2259 length:312 start_codon:yes stop_codon:yes gene_type:complete